MIKDNVRKGGVVGFIGLGNLGKAIAGRLAATGSDVIAWNRTAGKATGLSVRQADTPRAVAESADMILLNLFDSAAVRQVLTGTDGLLRDSVAGKTLIDTTTNHPGEVLEFHREVRSAGGSYLEAPVLGSVVPATKGQLVILVSGEKAVHDRSLGVLRTIGSTVFYLGEPGRATRMKLVNNLVLGTFMASLGEAIAVGERMGLGRELVVEILISGAGGSALLQAKKEKLLSGDFSPHFSAAAIEKDLHYLHDFVKSMGGKLTMGEAAALLFTRATGAGLGPEDFSGVVRVCRDLSPVNPGWLSSEPHRRISAEDKET